MIQQSIIVMLSTNIDVIVIGAGVSGMTAALYLKRANKNVLVLENSAPGGQLTQIPSIENYPGFLEISGPDLAMNIYNQLNSIKVDYKYGKVISIKKENNKFTVITDREEYKCNNVIIATGRTPRKLGLENEEKLFGRGISYCALCDGNFYKDLDVAVIGGADSALSESLYLSNIARKVYIIYRKDNFRAQEYLIERVLNKDNIIPIYNSNVTEYILENDKIKGVMLENGFLEVSGVFIYIGFEPNTEIVKDLCTLENGYIKVNNNLETSLEGMYAIGDVIAKNTYQIGTAIGEAVACANAIINKK